MGLRIVLSIAGQSAEREAARSALAQALEPLGFTVGERPAAGAPFLRLVYGGAPFDPAEDAPVVRIPAEGDGPPGDEPIEPVEIFDRGRNASLAFPPFDDRTEGEPLWRDGRGRAAVLRAPGRPSEIRFAFDLVRPLRFLLLRGEEAGPPRDDLDRFSHESSWAWRRGLLGEPLADRLGQLLRSAIEEALSGAGLATVRALPWPEGRAFAIALTHDEDLVVRWKRRLARHAIQSVAGGGRGRAAGFSLFVGDLREGPVPETVLSERIAAAEEKAGIRSTFFFLAVERDRFARRYRVGSPPIRSFVRALVDRGFAVGLHGGIDGYLSPETFLAERRVVAEAAGREIAGVRQHYLRLRVPETWEAQRRAGFRYDASLGFPDAPGFRAGTSFPLRPAPPGGFLSFPLHGMDRALAAAGVRKRDGWDRWTAPIRVVGGLVDILWHPYYTDVEHGAERTLLFRELIDWIASRKEEAWVATLDAAADWWLARGLVAVEALRAGERNLCRVRFGAPIEGLVLTPSPAGSDIRIEGADGAEAEIAPFPSPRLLVKKAASGAEVRLSLIPKRTEGLA